MLTDNEKPQAIVFHHIPKCAGTSFKHALKEVPAHEYINLARPWHWISIHNKLKKFDNSRIIIAGHYVSGITDCLNSHRIVNVIFLRNPMERFLSSVRFSRKVISEKYLNVFSQLILENNIFLRYALKNKFLKKWKKEDWFIGLVSDYEKSCKALSLRYNLESLPVYWKKITSLKKNTKTVSIMFKLLFIILNSPDYVFFFFLSKKAKNSISVDQSVCEEHSPVELKKTSVLENEDKSSWENYIDKDSETIIQKRQSGELHDGNVSTLLNIKLKKGDLKSALEILEGVFPDYYNPLLKYKLLHELKDRGQLLFLYNVAAVHYNDIQVDNPFADINLFRTKLFLVLSFTAVKQLFQKKEYYGAIKLFYLAIGYCGSLFFTGKFHRQYDIVLIKYKDYLSQFDLIAAE